MLRVGQRLWRATMASGGGANKTALVLVADGSEEIETVSIVDVLRRGGVDVVLASVFGTEVVKCSRGVRLVADANFSDVRRNPFDMLVLPGGMGGAKAFAETESVQGLLKERARSGQLIAALCAAPIALKAAGIGFGGALTSHPSVKEQLQADYAYTSTDRVVRNGNVITSAGPGTAMEFALFLVEVLQGKEKRLEVEKPLILFPGMETKA